MRIIKEPEVRKAEILDAAERLFAVKGYEATSVNSIIKAVKLSKGAFYYYFESKEEVLDKIIERRVSEGVKRAEEIAASSLPPLQKCLAVVVAQQFHDEYGRVFDIFKDEEDEEESERRRRSAALKKYDVECICRLSPCFSKVIEEGIEAGLFSTPFPLESAQILLCTGLTLFDWDYFPWTEEEAKVEIQAFLVAMERILGAKAGIFSELQDIFTKDIFYPPRRDAQNGQKDDRS